MFFMLRVKRVKKNYFESKEYFFVSCPIWTLERKRNQILLCVISPQDLQVGSPWNKLTQFSKSHLFDLLDGYV